MHNAYQISEPLANQRDGLRLLWKEAFGDTDEFLDLFESTAFSPSRCRCVTFNGKIVAALYWFDCTYVKEKIAYIYAVATSKKYRGQGLCQALMTDTHHHLKKQGYISTLLAPATDALFAFYKSLGYQEATSINETHFQADFLSTPAEKNLCLNSISKQAFSKLRRRFLPANSVFQENENLDFLATQAHFFTGNNFLLTARIENTHLDGIEFLGDTSQLPYIIKELNCTSAYIRTPGKEKPFTMYYPLVPNVSKPEYFGFVFD